MTTGENLKKIRLFLGLKQREVADILGVGQNTYSAIETNKIALTDRNRKTLIEKLDINPEFLDGKTERYFIHSSSFWAAMNTGRINKEKIASEVLDSNALEPQNTIQDRIKYILNNKYGGDIKIMAKATFISGKTIGDIIGETEKVPDYDVIRRIAETPSLGISLDWLITGKGSMLKESTPTPQVPERKRIPLYDDVSTIGGLNDNIANTSDTPSPSEWIDAGDWFPEATAAIRHYGDSMVEYPSGSILALKRVNDQRLILNGRNYVIETTEFRVTKQLQYDGGDYIMAYSSNRETYPDGRLIHAPIKIPTETVRHIDLVLGCVTKEYSNGAIAIRK